MKCIKTGKINYVINLSRNAEAVTDVPLRSTISMTPEVNNFHDPPRLAIVMAHEVSNFHDLLDQQFPFPLRSAIFMAPFCSPSSHCS